MKYAEDFMKEFADVDDRIGTFISEIRAGNKPVVCFGAGHCSGMFYDLLTDSGIDVLAFCDNDEKKYTSFLFGKAIMSLDAAIQTFEKFNVVITASVYQGIYQDIKMSSFSGEIYWIEESIAYHKSCLYGKEHLQKNLDRFSKAYNLLEDNISRLVYINSLKHTLSLDEKYIKYIIPYEIQGYFGADVLRNRKVKTFLDAGAYDGDTIKEFINYSNNRYDAIYGFEPDACNYLKLIEFASKLNDEKLHVYKAGVGKRSEQLRFTSHGTISRIDESGNHLIEIRAIDDVINGTIDMIKMDIEGAEADALYGAKKTITTYHPNLMISAYHKKEDMFVLIEQIKEYFPSSKIYMRHTFFYQTERNQPDVIIYAIS